eukprot:31312-Pelagococcus_subviridis.AAC.7
MGSSLTPRQPRARLHLLSNRVRDRRRGGGGGGGLLCRYRGGVRGGELLLLSRLGFSLFADARFVRLFALPRALPLAPGHVAVVPAAADFAVLVAGVRAFRLLRVGFVFRGGDDLDRPPRDDEVAGTLLLRRFNRRRAHRVAISRVDRPRGRRASFSPLSLSFRTRRSRRRVDRSRRDLHRLRGFEHRRLAVRCVRLFRELRRAAVAVAAVVPRALRPTPTTAAAAVSALFT